jgi:hypothetical protein
MADELEVIWKKAIRTLSSYCPSMYLVVVMKMSETSVKRADVLIKMWTSPKYKSRAATW